MEAESFAGFKYVEPVAMVLITKPEHTALVAVAEAAKVLSDMHDDAVFICGVDDQSKVDAALLQLNSCLAAVREGKANQ